MKSFTFHTSNQHKETTKKTAPHIPPILAHVTLQRLLKHCDQSNGYCLMTTAQAFLHKIILKPELVN